MLHAQWAKERLVQNKRVSCRSIQEDLRLPVSLRPHQITRELGSHSATLVLLYLHSSVAALLPFYNSSFIRISTYVTCILLLFHV